MSGARALASARRRRAGPSDQQPSNNNQRNSQPTPLPVPPPISASNQIVDTITDIPKPKMNPTQMLLHHNKVIENLQVVVTNLNEQVESQTTEIDNKISSLALDDNNIEFFKTKLNNLERELSEIKKHILKVQTFAMETNLQCIEIKKKYDSNVTSSEKQLNSSDEISGILSNN